MVSLDVRAVTCPCAILVLSCVSQDLLGLCARTDLVNVAKKRPLDLCITDAARDLIRAHASNTGPDTETSDTNAS